MPGNAEAVGAHIADDQGELFIQPAEGASGVLLNGNMLTMSEWLRDGDLVKLGEIRIRVVLEPGQARLEVERGEGGEGKAAEKPGLTPPPRPPGAGPTPIPTPTSEEPGAGVLIVPSDFTPYAARGSRRHRRTARWALGLTWIGVAVLGFAAWFTFTARLVEVQIDEEPDSVEIIGTVVQIEIGGRYLLRPGSYTVVAEKQGFRRLEAPLEISRQSNQVHKLHLEKLPGLLVVRTDPATGVSVTVDGEAIGRTPLEAIELEPGEHTVEVSAPRYRPATATPTIGGAGSTQTVDLALLPLWAPVSFDSSPRGAMVRVGGEDLGRTPMTADLLEGRHDVEIRLDGHKPYRTTLDVVAAQPLAPRKPVLQPVEGWLTLTTEPAGASISVGGEYRGRSPLDLELAPGVEYAISASLRGHRTVTETIRVASGQTHEINLELEAEVGEVGIVAFPADAEIFVDGISYGPVGQTLRLTAVPHEIEIRKPGYVTVGRRVTPRPGFPQSIELDLETEEQVRLEAAEAARPSTVQTSQGQEMRLIEGGRFRMGASRREPGRRSNETLREVEITRAFYLATEEVSNREFREFNSAHKAGVAGSSSLDLDGHPVVKITWEDAARYSNWLSVRESRTPFYVRGNGTLVPAKPRTNGYRLPTEAEWAWAARYQGGTSSEKYPWGDSLPVATGSGNYADASARAILPGTISGFNDSHPATAPVDSFPPNALGLFNMGGNVAEWVGDYYSIYSSSTSSVEQDPAGPEEGQYHVIRGAGWMDSTISELRLSYRDYGDKARPDVGFRVARSAD